jgi:hypothetical protein
VARTGDFYRERMLIGANAPMVRISWNLKEKREEQCKRVPFMNVLCLRCGNEVIDDEVPTLHKCSNCEKICFERKFFYPLERKIKRNFQKLKKTTYGSFVTGLFQFGSFSDGKSECGDIDFLITYDETKLKEIIDTEIEVCHLRYAVMFSDEDSILIPESYLIKGFWEFKTCEEYPDCLECRGSRGCKLPDDEYMSPLSTYCISECKKRNKVRLPNCCFTGCVFLNLQIKERISKDIYEILTEGEIDFTHRIPNMKIKVIDILLKKSIDELREEFDSMKVKKNLNVIRIL